MQVDKDLLQYCRDDNFPIDEMNENDFKRVKRSLSYNSFVFNNEMKKVKFFIERDIKIRNRRDKK